MTTAATIRRAIPEDAVRVAEVIAEAFATLPGMDWLVPDEAALPKILPPYFRIFVDYALEHGFIDVMDEGHAVAVWYPRTGPIPEPEDYDERLAAACAPWAERFQALDTLFEENHPTEPHHHLALMAVHPDHQGSGLGSALLRHHHVILDATGTAAYLEASSSGSRDLYARHGYGCREPFLMPDGTPFWPMWRPPGTRS